MSATQNVGNTRYSARFWGFLEKRQSLRSISGVANSLRISAVFARKCEITQMADNYLFGHCSMIIDCSELCEGDLKCGGGRSTLVEPLVVIRDFPAQWIRRKLSLTELARFREQGLSVAEIVARTGVPRTTVFRKIQELNLCTSSSG